MGGILLNYEVLIEFKFQIIYAGLQMLRHNIFQSPSQKNEAVTTNFIVYVNDNNKV